MSKNNNKNKGSAWIGGYVAPLGNHVLESGSDPFVHPARIKQRRTRKILLKLASHFLVPRQQQFFELYFLHSRTPEQIAAFCNKGHTQRNMATHGVYRSLRRIRWILERAWAFLVEHKLHKKLEKVLTPAEFKALLGWEELQKYKWKGAPKF